MVPAKRSIAGRPERVGGEDGRAAARESEARIAPRRDVAGERYHAGEALAARFKPGCASAGSAGVVGVEGMADFTARRQSSGAWWTDGNA